MLQPTMKTLFSLGAIVVTPPVLQFLAEQYTLPEDLLARHQTGDWGNINADDWDLSDEAVLNGSRVCSA